MKDHLIKLLRCPVCSAELFSDEAGKSCYCRGARKHCFDFAKSGYLNLTAQNPGMGDLREATEARRRFLHAGYYEILLDAVNKILAEHHTKTVLDAGCGEGYYTNRIALGNRTVLGVDLSKSGIDSAAKEAKQTEANAGYLIASLFSVPAADSSFDAVVNLFAPCCESEFARLLKDGGILVLVGAGEKHLLGLKQILYDNPYLNSGRADLPQNMTLLQKYHLTSEITVKENQTILDLFSMTPYYWRTSEKDREKLLETEILTTEIAFDIFVYRK